ncbi:MAG: FAD-dependent monooxygenase, partial [Polaribacter sp.]|nr:FAD-dependent monooxygenase [Polaribacter sp.]
TSINLKPFEKEFEVKTVAIHRATLHKILVQNIGDTKIYLNKKIKSLKQSSGKVDIFFEDGTTHTAEIVIGSDGIHSAVRKSIFNKTKLRDAKQICWRGISNAKINEKHKGELNELWSKGKRFGFVHISMNQIYWFALINRKKSINKDINLQELFSDYHPTINTIIDETPKEQILCNEIWDLKPIDKWYHKNICLVGDSAHATTPNMGQGAVQAIESALALSICIKDESSIEKAFNKYQKIRKEKANHVTETSWRIGKIAQLDNIIIIVLRNFMMKVLPTKITENQNRKLYKLNF